MTQLEDAQTAVDMATAARDAALVRETQLREELSELRKRITEASIDTAPPEMASWLALSLAYDVLLSKACAVIEAAKKDFHAQRARHADLKILISRTKTELEQVNKTLALYRRDKPPAVLQQLERLQTRLADLGG